MFKIQPNPTFEASVKIVSHGESQSLNVTFRAKTVPEYQGILDAIRKDKDPVGAMATGFLSLVEKWDADMDLSKESAIALHNHRPGALMRVIEAYGDQLIAAREGN